MYVYKWTAHLCWLHQWRSLLPNRSTNLLLTWLVTNWPTHFLPIPRGGTRQTTGASLPSRYLEKIPTKGTYIPADRDEACHNPPPARPPREWRTGERHVSRPPPREGQSIGEWHISWSGWVVSGDWVGVWMFMCVLLDLMSGMRSGERSTVGRNCSVPSHACTSVTERKGDRD